MTATTIRVQMAQRKDTAANWTAANPILLSGEIGYETDTKKFKIGNGSTNWNSLAYLPIPDGSGNLTITGNLEIGSTGSLTFEGSTADGFETTLAVTNPTADRTITLPNQSGTVLVSGNASIVDADIAANAEIAVSKLADGTARQLLQTDAAGTGVEWTSNIDVPGTLDVTSTATFDSIAQYPLGSADAPTITFTGDNNTGIYSPGADQVAISTGGSGRLFVDASGRVGVGTSPSYALHVSGTGTVSSRTLATDATGDASFFVQNDGNGICGPLVYGSTKTAYGALASNETAFYSNRSTTIMADGGSAVIKFATGGNTERARIDSSGRLLVGTSSASGSGGAKLEVAKQTLTTSDMGLASFQLASASSRWPQVFLEKSRGAAVGQKTLVVDGDSLGELAFRGADGTNYLTGANIVATVDGVASTNDLPTRLVFSTTADGAASPTERMRITNKGGALFYASTTSVVGAASSEAAGTTYYTLYGSYGATSTTTGSTSFLVYTNGNVQNTNNSYTAISDIKLKENIVDAGSQWADLKALRVRNYNLKEGQTHRQIGLIAQEVEPISPGLVYESPDRDAEGNDLGTVTKSVNYSVLYMKAVKALQEAMERIETLEARLTAAGI